MSFLDSFRTSSSTRQILIVSAIVLVLGAGLSAAYVFWIRKPYYVLFANLRPADAATVVAELNAKKIPYRLEDGGSTIRVPSNLVDSARLDIAGDDEPVKGTVGFELFNKSDMGLTEFAQRINYQRALQGELERTIMTMDAVESARVHLMLAEPTIFRDDRRPSKAAVTVAARAGKTISADTVHGIQRLVAAAVPDLVAGDVVVLGGDGKPFNDAAPDPAMISPQTQEHAAIEQYYAARIRQAVSQVYSGKVEVDVAARADPTSAPDAAAMSQWRSGERTFPLNVTLSFPNPPPPEVEDQLRRAASAAAGLEDGKGDRLILTQALDVGLDQANAPQQHIALPPAPAKAAAPWRLAGPPLFWLALLLPLLVLLFGAAAFLYRSRRAPRRLTEQQRREMARRLRFLLDEGEVHGTASF